MLSSLFMIESNKSPESNIFLEFFLPLLLLLEAFDLLLCLLLLLELELLEPLEELELLEPLE